MAAADRLWLSDRQVDLVTGDVVRAGETTARLTTKERELLAYLAGRAGQEVARTELLTDVWGYAPTARTRAVDFTVRRLRQKIEADPRSPTHIGTVHGIGYRFEAGAPPQSTEPATLPDSLPMRAVEPTGEAPDACAVVSRAFRHGARLVTLSATSETARRQVAEHVAAAYSPRVLWLNGGLGALAGLVQAAERESARRLLLRRDPPDIIVLDGVDPADSGAMEELATALRSVPAVRVLALARSRMGLAAEHVLALGVDPHRCGDLTELDEAWSQASEAVRTAWARLSACAGSVDLEGAEALLGSDAVDLLEALHDVGVLVSEDVDSGLRVHLLDSAARYGRQRSGTGIEQARQERRNFLLDRYAGLISELSLDMPSSLAADADELADLWSDADASGLDRARAAMLLGAAGAAVEEDRARLESLPDGVRLGELELGFHLLRARLRLATGAASEALSDARMALLRARDQGHVLGEGLSAAILGSALMRIGRLREAVEAVRHARAHLQRAGDRRAEISVLQILGRAEHELGRPDQAEATLREAVRLGRLTADPVPLAWGLIALGTLYRHRAALAPSEEAYDEAGRVLDGCSGVEAELVWGRLRLEAATLDLERGSLRRALAVLEPLTGHLERTGCTRDAGEAWLAVAGTRWQGGDLDGAIDGFERGRTAFEVSEDRLYTGLSLAWSGATAAAAGELDLADAWVEESRAHLEPLGLRRGRDVLAACRLHVDHARGRPAHAAIAWRNEVERSSQTWGDVRLALRLLDLQET